MENSSKENTRTTNRSFRETLEIVSESIGLETATPHACLKKALLILEDAKTYHNNMFVDHKLNQAIKYIELGIEKC